MGGILAEGQLVYGLQLPVQSLSTRFAEPWEATAGIDELSALARAADRSGFFYVAVCDHVAIPRPHDEAMGTQWWDTLVTLGFLAAITERAHLLSHVYVPAYRHPLVVAKGFSTLDAVSGGRAILGVGAGHVEGEFDLLGADFASRGAVLDESIDVVRAAFSDEYPTHEGPRWTIRGAGMRPRPVRRGGPPIWVGGSSAPAMRRAAERGDGWLPQGPPAIGMREGIRRVRELREAAGIQDPIDIGLITEPIHLGTPRFEVGDRCLTGRAGPIAERLRSYGELGADHLQVRFRARSAAEMCEQIERFGAEVGPLLGSSRGDVSGGEVGG